MKLRYIAEAGSGGRKPIYTPRIEEFAEELGVHPNILRKYFKLGCPQTSAEDIKKWREEYLRRPGAKQVYTPRIKELAKETGLSAITLRRYFKLGCPQTSVEDIKKWREEYLRRPGKKKPGRKTTSRIKELAKETGLSAITLREYFKLGCPQTSAEDIRKWREECLRRPGARQIYTPRIEELAKEAGVHPVLLRRYFKLGCPQTSVEGIKKLREEYLRRPGAKQVYTPRIKELAKETGLSAITLRRYFKLGCPQASVEDIKKWREEYLRRPGKKKPGRKPTSRIKELKMVESRQHTTESKRDFRSRLESVLND